MCGVRVAFEGRQYEQGEQSLLDCLLGNGVALPSACRVGACQSCLMRVLGGEVPARARQGLSAAQLARRLFLACQCFPSGDLEVARADDALERHAATVLAVRALGPDMRELRLRTAGPYDYRAGQFLQLTGPGPVLSRAPRNYSLASVPALDSDLAVHVARVAGGLVSGWVFDAAQAGDAVVLSEARGNCSYGAESPDASLLLIGTGSGVAPLYGMARDALHQGHRGRIALFHGSRKPQGLYLDGVLRALATDHENFHYGACVDTEAAPVGSLAGTPVAVALRCFPDLHGWRVTLCGNPAMVEAARMACFLAGAASSAIHADPFLPTTGSIPRAGAATVPGAAA